MQERLTVGPLTFPVVSPLGQSWRNGISRPAGRPPSIHLVSRRIAVHHEDRRLAPAAPFGAAEQEKERQWRELGGSE